MKSWSVEITQFMIVVIPMGEGWSAEGASASPPLRLAGAPWVGALNVHVMHVTWIYDMVHCLRKKSQRSSLCQACCWV